MNILKEINYKGEICVVIKKEELNSNSENCNTGDCNTGNCNTGDWNTGNMNTGDYNTGDCNTSDWNTGNCNTSDWNTGNRNTGNRNTGDWNTGDCNTGDWNTGDCNTGNYNTGNRNTGNRNTGDWNTGNRNTGFFNTTEPVVRFFNKDTNLKYSERENDVFPEFLFFELTEWIFGSDMTEAEKEKYNTYKTTGGYLKIYEYKEAFKKAWNEASKEDKDKLFALPNFDADIFKEISGIDVFKD